MQYKNIFATCAIALSMLSAQAQTARALPILERSTDARSLAMGSTLLGHTDGMYVYTNPSAMLYADRALSLDVSSAIYPKEEFGRLMQYNASGAYRFLDRHAVSVGFRYLGGLTFHKISSDLKERGEFKPYDWTLDLAYAFRLSDALSVYASGTFYQSFSGVSATGATFSLGASYRKELRLGAMPARLTLGVRALDLGPGVQYSRSQERYDLPSSLVLGGDLGLRLTEQHQLTLAMSGRAFFATEGSRELRLGVGAEYTYREMLALRAGYDHSKEGHKGFAFGAGLKISQTLKLDAAYSLAKLGSISSNTLMVGLGLAL